jgi:hypothetical protein
MRRVGKVLAVLGLALPGLALAQGTVHRERQVREERREVRTEADQRSMFTVRGGAGVMTYGGEAAGLTAPGATYNVSGEVHVLPWMRGELGYLGGLYTSEQLTGDDRATILENGGQALVKVGPTLGRNLFPHALGGLAVTRLNLRNEERAAGLIDEATNVRVPVGVGLDYELPSAGAAALMVGARGTYGFATNANAFPTLPDASDTNVWTGSLQVGGSF